MSRAFQCDKCHEMFSGSSDRYLACDDLVPINSRDTKVRVRIDIEDDLDGAKTPELCRACFLLACRHAIQAVTGTVDVASECCREPAVP